ncbi:acyltransferase family protein [Rhodoblastus sp.]|uniref:acyltransferase family protein n=1 Tax=Rhodoblastus sp. TaxID=1962975 RepID=UPI0035B14E10
MKNPETPDYRRDIDGLRAVAVLAVLIFHGFPTLAPGGFVGVDVFFVISGYLITGIIARELNQRRFSILTFYRRRVLRLFPALLLVLAAAYGLAWHSLYGDEFKQLALHILAGGLFVSNFLLWTESGYFDIASSAKPLLHLWSLGVEEQFYLIWPWLLMFCARRSVAAWSAIAAVAILSFGVNLALVGSHPEAAFFLPFGRLWELAIGGLLALSAAKRPAPRVADWLSLGGIVAIVAAALLLREGPGFPGWRALAPTLGAGALLFAGPKAWVNRQFLARAPLVGIGLISYPLYLWHWIFLSYAYILAGGTPPWGSRAALLALSLLAAWATYFFVEKRIRNGRRAKEKALVLCVAMAALLVLAGVTWLRGGFDYRRGSNPLADVSTAAMGAGKELTEARCLVAPETIGDRFFCASDKRGPARVLLWGDSKGEALFWGLMRGSSPDRRWSLVGRWGCPPLLDGDPAAPGVCPRVNRAIAEALPNHPEIETVVLTFAAHYFRNPAPDDPQVMTPQEKALDATIAMLLGQGRKVVVTLDNPDLPDPRRCMDRAALGWPPIRWLLGMERDATQVTHCDRPLAEFLAESRAYRAMMARLAARRPEVLIFDPTPILCDASRGICPMARDGRYLYSYGNHISDSASDRIARELIPLIDAESARKQ